MKKNTSIYTGIARINAMLNANAPDLNRIVDAIIELRIAIKFQSPSMWASADRRFVSRFNTTVRQYAAISGWSATRLLITRKTAKA